MCCLPGVPWSPAFPSACHPEERRDEGSRKQNTERSHTGSFAHPLPRLPLCGLAPRQPAKRRGCGNCSPPFSAPGSGGLQFAQDDKKISVSHRGCRGRQPLHSHRQSSSLVVGAGVPDGPFHGFSQLLSHTREKFSFSVRVTKSGLSAAAMVQYTKTGL